MSSLTVISRIVPKSIPPEEYPAFFKDLKIDSFESIQRSIHFDGLSDEKYIIETIYSKKDLTDLFNEDQNFAPLTPDSQLAHADNLQESSGFCFSVPIFIKAIDNSVSDQNQSVTISAEVNNQSFYGFEPNTFLGPQVNSNDIETADSSRMNAFSNKPGQKMCQEINSTLNKLENSSVNCTFTLQKKYLNIEKPELFSDNKTTSLCSSIPSADEKPKLASAKIKAIDSSNSQKPVCKKSGKVSGKKITPIIEQAISSLSTQSSSQLKPNKDSLSQNLDDDKVNGLSNEKDLSKQETNKYISCNKDSLTSNKTSDHLKSKEDISCQLTCTIGETVKLFRSKALSQQRTATDISCKQVEQEKKINLSISKASVRCKTKKQKFTYTRHKTCDLSNAQFSIIKKTDPNILCLRRINESKLTDSTSTRPSDHQKSKKKTLCQQLGDAEIKGVNSLSSKVSVCKKAKDVFYKQINCANDPKSSLSRKKASTNQKPEINFQALDIDKASVQMKSNPDVFCKPLDDDSDKVDNSFSNNDSANQKTKNCISYKHLYSNKSIVNLSGQKFVVRKPKEDVSCKQPSSDKKNIISPSNTESSVCQKPNKESQQLDEECDKVGSSLNNKHVTKQKPKQDVSYEQLTNIISSSTRTSFTYQEQIKGLIGQQLNNAGDKDDSLNNKDSASQKINKSSSDMHLTSDGIDTSPLHQQSVHEKPKNNLSSKQPTNEKKNVISSSSKAGNSSNDKDSSNQKLSKDAFCNQITSNKKIVGSPLSKKTSVYQKPKKNVLSQHSDSTNNNKDDTIKNSFNNPKDFTNQKTNKDSSCIHPTSDNNFSPSNRKSTVYQKPNQEVLCKQLDATDKAVISFNNKNSIKQEPNEDISCKPPITYKNKIVSPSSKKSPVCLKQRENILCQQLDFANQQPKTSVSCSQQNINFCKAKKLSGSKAFIHDKFSKDILYLKFLTGNRKRYSLNSRYSNLAKTCKGISFKQLDSNNSSSSSKPFTDQKKNEDTSTESISHLKSKNLDASAGSSSVDQKSERDLCLKLSDTDATVVDSSFNSESNCPKTRNILCHSVTEPGAEKGNSKRSYFSSVQKLKKGQIGNNMGIKTKLRKGLLKKYYLKSNTRQVTSTVSLKARLASYSKIPFQLNSSSAFKSLHVNQVTEKNACCDENPQQKTFNKKLDKNKTTKKSHEPHASGCYSFDEKNVVKKEICQTTVGNNKNVAENSDKSTSFRSLDSKIGKQENKKRSLSEDANERVIKKFH